MRIGYRATRLWRRFDTAPAGPKISRKRGVIGPYDEDHNESPALHASNVGNGPNG
jgi:hypothetical protein